MDVYEMKADVKTNLDELATALLNVESKRSAKAKLLFAKEDALAAAQDRAKSQAVDVDNVCEDEGGEDGPSPPKRRRTSARPVSKPARLSLTPTSR